MNSKFIQLPLTRALKSKEEQYQESLRFFPEMSFDEWEGRGLFNHKLAGIIKFDDLLESHLYIGHDFNSEIETLGVLKIQDLSSVTLMQVLNMNSITIPRLKRLITFMETIEISFKN